MKRTCVYAVLVGLGALCLMPLLWTLSIALKSSEEYAREPGRLIPRHPAWDNFAKAWTELPFGHFVVNTVLVAAISTAAQVVVSSLVAYGFARFRFRGRGLTFGMMLATMMLPHHVTMIPVFLIWRALHGIDTYFPLVAPAFFGGAFNIFLLRQFMLGLPLELDEAAMLDGAGYLRIWWRVLLPLCGPALATVGVLSFLGQWDNFEGPLIYLNTPEKYTVSLGLRMFQDSFGSEFGQLMAASLVHIVPTVIIFFCAQRYFMRGLNFSGLGGR
ncbi:MAG TPA: carbohydrate ABC transporter permease [Fimbriimonadaceae bacterium]|nr:carbohydrate ABC transporter permease [Fimbriimonadaceae bacterium]